MKGLLLGLMLLSGQAKAESIILPFQSFADEFAVQALQQVLDDKFSVRGGTLDATVYITTLTLNNLRVYSGGKDVIVSTAAGASGEPGSLFIKGSSGFVGMGTTSPDEVLEIQTRGDQGGILISTGPTNYGTVIGNYQGGVQNDFYSLVEPALPTAASPETLLRLNNQYNGSIWVGPRTDGSATGTFYPGSVSGAGGDCSIASAPLPKFFVCNDKASAWAGVFYTTATSANGLRVRNTNGTGTILQLESGGSIGGNMSVSPSAVSSVLLVGATGHMRLTGRFDVYNDTSPIQSAANGSTFKLQHTTPNDVMLNAGGNGENLRLAVEGSTVVTVSSLAYVGFGRDPRFQVDISSYANASAICIAGACNILWPAAISGASNGAVSVANSLGNQFVPNSLFIARSSAVWINLTPDVYNALGSQPTLGLGTPSGAAGPTVSLVSDGSQNAQLAYFNGSTYQWIWAYDKSLGATDNMTLYNAAGTRVVNIEQSGDFGLNDKTPDGQLEVVSNQSSSGYIVAISSQNDSTGGILSILGNGFVGIGSANPTVRLDVAGSVSATSFAGIGTDLTFLNADDITMGTLDAARLPAGGYNGTYVRLTGDTMTGTLNISSSFTATGQGVVGGTFTVQGADASVGGSTWVVTNGRMGVGTSTPGDRIEILSEVTGAVGLQISNYSTTNPIPLINFRSSSGTAAAPALVGNGFLLWRMFSQAHDGSQFRGAARIDAVVDGTPGASDLPSRLAFHTSPDGTATITERMRIDNAGNMGLGATSFGTSAAKVFAIGEGTPPTSSPADMVQFFSTSPAAGQAEAYVLDEQGNTTLLSPHGFRLFQPDIEDPALPWVYLSKNFYAGKEINVDMLKLARLVEQLSGEQIVYVRDLPDSEVRDWNADEEAKRLHRNGEIAAWDAAAEKTGERPKPYVKKPAPAWLAPRLKRK